MTRHGMYVAVIHLAMVSSVLGGVGCDSSAAPTRHDITSAQLQEMLQDADPLVLLDVRTAEEFAAGHIEGALNRPVEDIETWWSTLDPEVRTAAICKGGARSRPAADTLLTKGFTDIYNVLGGMDGWPGETVTGAE